MICRLLRVESTLFQDLSGLMAVLDISSPLRCIFALLSLSNSLEFGKYTHSLS